MSAQAIGFCMLGALGLVYVAWLAWELIDEFGFWGVAFTAWVVVAVLLSIGVP